MEENWINKLIELLDEYDSVQYHKINHKIENWDIYRNVWGTDGWHQVCRYCKKFWFIQWLVDNDKIDFNNIKRIILNYEVEDNEAIEYYDLDFATKEETLLMLLSIQNNPIEFLISILK